MEIVDVPQPMRGRDIVAFAKDWGEDPTSCNHVLTELARHNRVLWVNSISTRQPDLRSASDSRKILRKLKSFARGPRQVRPNLWVYTPLVIPSHSDSVAVLANRAMLRATVGQHMRRLGMRKVQLWTWVPTSAPYFDAIPHELLVYYCTDDWSQFDSLDGGAMQGMMRSIATRADVVFGTSSRLVDKLSAYNARTFLASHGVDYEKFAVALDPSLPIPPDLEGLSRPIVGYYGLVESWLDLDLIATLAKRHPAWSFVLIGKECVDTSHLRRLPNVHLLGRRSHDELPHYCRQFAAAMIPHRINELTLHMNPIKLREYLSAGVPVVSTNLPEVARYAGYCAIGKSHEDFDRALIDAVETDTPVERKRRSDAMRQETWPSVVAGLCMRIAGLVNAPSALSR